MRGNEMCEEEAGVGGMEVEPRGCGVRVEEVGSDGDVGGVGVGVADEGLESEEVLLGLLVGVVVVIVVVVVVEAEEDERERDELACDQGLD